MTSVKLGVSETASRVGPVFPVRLLLPGWLATPSFAFFAVIPLPRHILLALQCFRQRQQRPAVELKTFFCLFLALSIVQMRCNRVSR